MRKKFVGLLSIIIIFVGFFLLFRVVGSILPRGKGALQITSSVPAKVMLNGKNIGITPICKCDQNDRIDAGNYTLQLIPEGNIEPYTTKLKVSRGVLTAVDRTFLPGSYASSYILTLEKISKNTPELFVSSLPAGALVSVDGNETGTTPNLITQISASEHEIELQKGGFGKKTIRIKTVNGYKLMIEAVLGTQPQAGEVLPGSEGTPTATPTVSQQLVVILATPTGFLRVRQEASTASTEIGRVLPGDELLLLEEANDWFKIQLKDGQEGWISTSFAQKKP
ncbi:MAG: PEGA domain-containing protein [Candidatus Levybacteria bacterium]|nr:PEGA domain-containing protein [Candidatus Levybacteria bacterium]